jgi:hypothetical protein
MLIMIVHSCGSPIPYNVISDLAANREVEGTHIPLPARSTRERLETIKDFLLRAEENPDNTFLLVVTEDLEEELERSEKVDCVLLCYHDSNGRPAVSVAKNGIGDEGLTFEEYLLHLKNYAPLPQQQIEVEEPKYFTRGAA